MGAKAAVTPPGRAEVNARLTMPVNPFSGVTVMPPVAVAPCNKAKLVCAGAIVKEETGAGVTDRLNSLMVSESAPLASMLTGDTPSVADLPAERVSMQVWPIPIEDGLNDAETPGGSSGVESLMVSVY